jgi:hypothetical protein
LAAMAARDANQNKQNEAESGYSGFLRKFHRIIPALFDTRDRESAREMRFLPRITPIRGSRLQGIGRLARQHDQTFGHVSKSLVTATDSSTNGLERKNLGQMHKFSVFAVFEKPLG